MHLSGKKRQALVQFCIDLGETGYSVQMIGRHAKPAQNRSQQERQPQLHPPAD
jgi:hypothetical protein